MNPAEKIAENIKAVMNKKNICNRELADLTKTTEVTMSRWLSGHRMITASGLYRVAKVLGVTMENLMEGSEDE